MNSTVYFIERPLYIGQATLDQDDTVIIKLRDYNVLLGGEALDCTEKPVPVHVD